MLQQVVPSSEGGMCTVLLLRRERGGNKKRPFSHSFFVAPPTKKREATNKPNKIKNINIYCCCCEVAVGNKKMRNKPACSLWRGVCFICRGDSLQHVRTYVLYLVHNNITLLITWYLYIYFVFIMIILSLFCTYPPGIYMILGVCM